ncbi:MAG: hypothetical protein MJZ23_04905 [Paludibacteraceae bacterium]|nr:hypothetical protein [Paludibacteraceae bacterium]
MSVLPLASLLAGAIGQGWATRQSAKAARQQQQLLDRQQDQSHADFYQQLHQVSPNGPAAQAQMAQVRRFAERQNRVGQNVAVAGNQTAEQTLAARQKVADQVGNAANRVAVNQAETERQLRQQHRREQDAIASQKRALAQQKAQNLANMGKNLATSLTAALASYNLKKQKT